MDASDGNWKPDFLTFRDAFWRPHTKSYIWLAVLNVAYWGAFAVMVRIHSNVGSVLSGLAGICVTLYLVTKGIGLMDSLIPTFAFYAKDLLARQGWTIRFRSNWHKAECQPGCQISLERNLCNRCHQIIDASHLLTGSHSRWPLVSSSEYHRLYKLQQLETSASTCQLCRLLLRSVRLSTQSVTPAPLSPNISRAQIEGVLSLEVKEKLRKGQDPELTLQLWVEIYKSLRCFS